MPLIKNENLLGEIFTLFVMPIVMGVIVLTIVLLIVRKITSARDAHRASEKFQVERFTNHPEGQSWRSGILRKVLWRKNQNTKTSNPTSVAGFTSVAGVDEAVEELQELVERLIQPGRWTKWGIPAPKGALLYGPPGTGKTLLAKAVAAEAGVPFYPLSGSDFVEKYVGVGASRVRALFKQAKNETGGAIVFIDEIDAIGRRRGGDTEVGGGSEQENTLNALLVELDGFNERNNIIVIGATNRPDLIDKALVRPGRLDKRIMVPLPDKKGRIAILETHMQGKPFKKGDINSDIIAARTAGLSGAEMSQIINEACLSAERAGETEVTQNHLDNAVATVVMGKARTSTVMSERDRNITAWHEAGHATVAMLLPEANDPTTVTIVPRGVAGGFTWTTSEDEHYQTVEQLKASIMVTLAGRVGEEIYLNGTYTTGPSSDYEKATKLAYLMVTTYGMSEEVGIVSWGTDANMFVVMNNNQIIADAVGRILNENLTKVRELLSENYTVLQTLAEELLEKETLSGPDLILIKSVQDKKLEEKI